MEIFKSLGSVTFHMASKMALVLTASNKRANTSGEDFYSYSRPRRRTGIFHRLELCRTTTSNSKGGWGAVWLCAQNDEDTSLESSRKISSHHPTMAAMDMRFTCVCGTHAPEARNHPGGFHGRSS